MKIEKIRKSHKKEIIIGALAICVIGGALTFATSKAKYKLTQDIPLVRGTVNYKVPDMRIVALYTENDSGDYVEANDVPTSGYALNQEKSMCKVYDGTTTIENAPKDNNVTIEYKNGKVNFLGLSKKNTRCYLYFDKYVPPITMDNIIASLNVKSTTPDFSQAATAGDEGVYKVSDGMYGGTSYYWRGAATTNYVKFAGFCWRIVRINGDKTMRLIYDGTTCDANGTKDANSIAKTSIQYNASYNQSNYVGWSYEGTLQRPSNLTTSTASNAKTQLESWYNSNITGTNAQKVVQGKYCNDRNVASGYTWAIAPSSTLYYAGYKRLYTDYQPTLSCPTGDVYELSVGLITADEVEFAGGKDAMNSFYYLYNGQNYWTMSPFFWNSSGIAQVFRVNTLGYLDSTSVDRTCGLRPVINMKADTTFKSGSAGTLNNPYVVQ